MRFYACDLQSGQVRDEYPMEITSDLTRQLKTYGTGAVQLPIRHPQCPATWAEDIIPWRTLLVVCNDDDKIVWAGIPAKRSRTPAQVVSYDLVTVEKYFDRRYMVDAEYDQVEQITIARDMAEVGGDSVTGIGLEYRTTATGVKRDRSYYGDEDARILQRLQQLSNVQNGFEWTIEVSWNDRWHSAVQKVFRAQKQIGYVSTDPDLTFELTQGIPGPITDFTFEEQWGDGEAATLALAVGDGEGEDKPYSIPQIDSSREAAGWPRLEERASQSGVIEDDTLNAAAKGMAERMFGGQKVIAFTAQVDMWPTPADVTLGDTARVIIDTEQLKLDQVWRIIGYSISQDRTTWTPVLAAIGDYGEGGIEDAGE